MFPIKIGSVLFLLNKNINELRSLEGGKNMDFTLEQENFICIFDVSNRNACINGIRAALPDFDDLELREIANDVLKKLDNMSDEDFSELIFSPAYYDDEMEEV